MLPVWAIWLIISGIFLLLEIFTNKGIGTAILNKGGERFYDENK